MAIATTRPTFEQIYKDVLGNYDGPKEFLWKHRGRFVHYAQSGVADGWLDPGLTRRNFRLERLSYALDPARDELIGARGLEVLSRLLRKGSDGYLETPQYFWMRLAMERSLGQPNPTRRALELYERLSTLGRVYDEEIFNNQRLLFDTTLPVNLAGATSVPEHYYSHGWAVLDGVADQMEAVKRQEEFINSLDAERLPLHRRFYDRIQLAKADRIPVCDDIVATSFQVLHFDMGHSFVESDGQLFVSHVGVYLPASTDHEVTARTRLVELGGLVSNLGLPAEEIIRRVSDYARKHGDGWTGHNTYRLACFIRFIDALKDKPELASQIDRTVGQWFENDVKVDGETAYEKERRFYAKNGIDLPSVEKQIALKPGQMLVLDNTRVIHGRIGKRRSKELVNLMFGIETITQEDIGALRDSICRLVCERPAG